MDLSEKITQTKESMIENFESRLHTLSEEIEQVKSNIR